MRPTNPIYISYTNDWEKEDIDFIKNISEVVIDKMFGLKNYELSILLTNDKEMKKLNKTYRSINKSTNVLSFSLKDSLKESDTTMLGDIVIAKETIKTECFEQKKSFKDHLAHMFIHGFLHLTGFMHENDDEALIMEEKEAELLSLVGISNPYGDNL